MDTRKGRSPAPRRSRRGAFELADGGSLLLDEIGELPLELQAKLLRVLQSGELWPLGAERAKTVDVRVIAATHRDLPAEVEAGRFRADLYHRLAGYCLRVPALRERGNDVLLIANAIVAREAPMLGLGTLPTLTPSARRFVMGQRWPGNVRELEHALTRACLLASAEAGAGPPRVEAAHFQHPAGVGPSEPAPTISPGAPEDQPLPEDFNAAVDDYRRHLVLRALSNVDGNWSAAARLLGMDRSNLHRLGRRLGLRD